jgi:hypothetical protein
MESMSFRNAIRCRARAKSTRRKEQGFKWRLKHNENGIVTGVLGVKLIGIAVK